MRQRTDVIPKTLTKGHFHVGGGRLPAVMVRWHGPPAALYRLVNGVYLFVAKKKKKKYHWQMRLLSEWKVSW